VFNDFASGNVKAIDDIKIEYAPSPAKKYLNDKISFDAYIEFVLTPQKTGHNLKNKLG